MQSPKYTSQSWTVLYRCDVHIMPDVTHTDSQVFSKALTRYHPFKKNTSKIF